MQAQLTEERLADRINFEKTEFMKRQVLGGSRS